MNFQNLSGKKPETEGTDGVGAAWVDGEFAGELIAGTFAPFGAGRASGGMCVLRLKMPDGSPFNLRVRFLTEGPPHVLLRDLRALAAWVSAVGAAPAPGGFANLEENLWIAGRDKRVLFDLRTREDHRGLPETFVVNVRVERTTHA